MGGIDGIAARLGGQPVISDPASLLQLAPTGAPERRRLDNGYEILTVTGRIDNTTRTELPVPDIRAELLSSHGQPIYAWPISAPAPTMEAGARSEERRVGKECVSTCRSRSSQSY